MSTLKTKWGKSIAVVMALALTVASVPGADAQAAKKAKLSTKKLTIKVGKKKTIKIKNKVKKAKYTFKVKKASIAKVSKKGVVTAKKAGKTTITVKEKSGKKTRKLGTVKITVKKNTTSKKTTPTTAPATVAPTASATAAPTAPSQGGVSNPTQAPDPTQPAEPTEIPGTPGPTKTPKPTPTVKPEPTPDAYAPEGKGWQKLDLSSWSGGSDNYLETGGQIVLSEVELETVPIPQTLDAKGDKIEVLIRGSVPEGSDGFRYWISNETGGTLTTMGHYSNFGEGVEDPRNADAPQADLDVSAFKPGQFQVQRVLEHINKDGVADDQLTGTRLLLKGPVYGTTLDGIIITGIWVRYGEDIGTDPGVETPGTETPGTETPGTETPGTETSDGEKPTPGDQDKNVTVELSAQTANKSEWFFADPATNKYVDGGVTFTLAEKSNQAMGFYIDASKAPIDLNKFSKAEITISAKRTKGGDTPLRAAVSIDPDLKYDNCTVCETGITASETEQVVSLDLSKAAATDKGYGVCIQVKGWECSDADTTDVTIKSIKFIAK